MWKRVDNAFLQVSYAALADLTLSHWRHMLALTLSGSKGRTGWWVESGRWNADISRTFFSAVIGHSACWWTCHVQRPPISTHNQIIILQKLGFRKGNNLSNSQEKCDFQYLILFSTFYWLKCITMQFWIKYTSQNSTEVSQGRKPFSTSI